MRLWGMSILLFVFVVVAGCSSNRTPGLINSDITKPKDTSVAEVDESVFKDRLDAYMLLSDDTREDVRDRATNRLDTYDQLNFENKQYRDARKRFWYYKGVQIDNSTRGVGVGNSLVQLREATDMDPSYAEAWGIMGSLFLASGDMYSGKDCLDNARLAILARDLAEDPVDEEFRLLVYRERAWVLRDLTLWDDGLDAVKEGLTYKHGDPELVLIKGLLLAGAGRYSEAHSLAVRMPAIKFRKTDYWHYAQSETKSDYANRWIKSQALMAVGEYDMARQVLGDLVSYENRLHVPYMDRFWADVGLISELVGERKADRYYAQGFIARRYEGFYPWRGGNLMPMVLNVPNPAMPVYTSYGGRFWVGGSPLTYVASQMNTMAMATFEKQRTDAAGRAMRGLDILEARNIRPDVCRAMRGRVHYSFDRKAAARVELEAAHKAFFEQGKVDAGTSLLLGMLEMAESKDHLAIAYLNEAVVEDEKLAAGWRMLGVLKARAGHLEMADVAMNKAVALEPYSVAALFNRGLLRLQQKRFVESVADLEKAFKINPDNHEVQRVLQMAATSYRANGGDPAELRLQVEEYNVVASSNGPPVDLVADPAALVAQLNAEIVAFFVVPDSIAATLGPEDESLKKLAIDYENSHDAGVRRDLALAYMDRKMYTKVQELLAPGWGDDLEPGEEVILLYVDRLLGEEKRSEALAESLLAGEMVSNNAALLSLIRDPLRVPWWGQKIGPGHHLEQFGANSYGLAAVFGYDYAMGVGFSRIRHSQKWGYSVPILNRWFFDAQRKTYGNTQASAVSGGVGTSRAKVGGNYK